MAEPIVPGHDERMRARCPALGTVMTVMGPVPADQLGVILPHEHVLADFRVYHEPFYPELSDRRVELDMLGMLRRHPTTCLDNLLLDDQQVMSAELRLFRQAGGATVVDLTSRGPRAPADVAALRLLAQESGLHIIAGTGLYAPAFYPESLARETVDGLAEQFTRELEVGIEGTGIRAGIVGEIEVTDLADSRQRLVLTAAARAALHAGVPLAVDCPPGEGFEAVHRLLQGEGMPPAGVWLCGMDRVMVDDLRQPLHPAGVQGQRPADLGYYLLFDGFGQEFYVRGGESRTPRDFERVRWLRALVDRGHLRQLLVSQGINRKQSLARFGGWGYAHILENIVPMMSREKLPPKAITTLTMYNPARALVRL